MSVLMSVLMMAMSVISHVSRFGDKQPTHPGHFFDPDGSSAGTRTHAAPL